jgi:hypothetical protein
MERLRISECGMEDRSGGKRLKEEPERGQERACWRRSGVRENAEDGAMVWVDALTRIATCEESDESLGGFRYAMGGEPGGELLSRAAPQAWRRS